MSYFNKKNISDRQCNSMSRINSSKLLSNDQLKQNETYRSNCLKMLYPIYYPMSSPNTHIHSYSCMHINTSILSLVRQLAHFKLFLIVIISNSTLQIFMYNKIILMTLCECTQFTIVLMALLSTSNL